MKTIKIYLLLAIVAILVILVKPTYAGGSVGNTTHPANLTLPLGYGWGTLQQCFVSPGGKLKQISFWLTSPNVFIMSEAKLSVRIYAIKTNGLLVDNPLWEQIITPQQAHPGRNDLQATGKRGDMIKGQIYCLAFKKEPDADILAVWPIGASEDNPYQYFPPSPFPLGTEIWYEVVTVGGGQ